MWLGQEAGKVLFLFRLVAAIVYTSGITGMRSSNPVINGPTFISSPGKPARRVVGQQLFSEHEKKRWRAMPDSPPAHFGAPVKSHYGSVSCLA